LNSRSGRDDFNESRIGADPQFGYGQLLLQRSTILTKTLTSVARGFVQIASGNLVPSEQFSVGGANTVRGYEERIITGDSGYSFTHELHQRLPSIALPKRLPKLDPSAVFFWDYGRTIIKEPLIGYQNGVEVYHERKSNYLASVGVGLRAVVGTYFNASVDYARQLEEVEVPGAAHHRVHVKLTLTF
jgi:hemolysin activation/secretion protein